MGISLEEARRMPASDHAMVTDYIRRYGFPGTDEITILLAMICATLYNINKKAGTTPMSVDDYLPRLKPLMAKHRAESDNKSRFNQVMAAFEAKYNAS